MEGLHRLPCAGSQGPADAVFASLAGGYLGKISVAAVPSHLGKFYPIFTSVFVEEAKLYSLGDLGKDLEIRSISVIDCTQRIGFSGPYVHVFLRYSCESEKICNPRPL